MKATFWAPAVAFLLLACSCPGGDAKPTPEEQEYLDYCMEKYGEDTTIAPAPGGGYMCINCAGSAYDDPKTGDRMCCNRLHEKFTVDPKVKTEGACCRPPETFSYDPDTDTGGCCPPGQHWEEEACVKKEKPSPDPDDDKCPACPKGYACACDGDLGIKYGHCYTLTDVNGKHLGRDIAGVYQSGGEIDGLIFKVCKSTDDCDEDKGEYVADDDTWFMQDQQGSRTRKGAGWFGNIQPHMKITQFDKYAAEFRGEGLCMFGDCSICLRLKDSGLSSPCPMVNKDNTHIGASRNPNNCKPFRIQEATCMKDVPAK